MPVADLDLSPAPGAAAVSARWAAQSRLELRLLLTNGEQLLLTLVIPVVVLVAVVRLGLADIQTATAGVLSLTVLSSAFAATAIATGFERRSRVLKALSATPLARSGLLAGKVVATAVVVAIQWLVVLLIALVMGWSAAGANLLLAACFGALGTATLGAWGFALAGLLRAEATLAVANAVFLVLMFAGGTVLPAEFGPPALQAAIDLLPSAALASGLRIALDAGGSSPALVPALVLAAWLLAGLAVAVRTFRWE